MESNHFDDSIKKVLEQFNAEGTSNWERMESLLNDAANADLSERAEDQILRNKLEELTPEMPAAHWALMNAQLAGMEGEEELEDVMLDGKAYESLNAYQAPYNAAHWPIMEEKIENSFSWRKKIVRYKVAELAILLLTFITILQYYPEAKKILPKLNLQKPSIATPLASIPDSDMISESLSVLPSEAAEAVEQATEVIIANSIELDPATSPANADEFVSNIVRANSFSLFADMVNNKSKRAIQNNSSLNINNSSIIIEEDIVSAPRIAVIDNTKLEAFPLIDFKPAVPLLFNNSRKIAAATASPKFSKLGLRIGMYTLGSYDAVDKNPNKIDLLSRSASTVGYGTGISIGFRTGRWELESGLGYLSKSVKPSTPIADVSDVDLIIREYSGNAWTETQYDIIDIPVQIKFDFLQRTRWTAYVQSGVSMNINQNIIYRYDQIFGGSGLDDEQSALTPGVEEENSNRAKAFDVTQVSTNVGTSQEALEFQSNASINWNIGFGLERALNRRYAAFLQTQYVHQLSLSRELGLENESSIFRSPQLRLGVKATIFK